VFLVKPSHVVLFYGLMAVSGERSNRLKKGKGSLAQRTAERIRKAIFAGQWPPGTPLRELHLARRHRVSQSTVREALQQLEAAGLVSRQPQLGTTVTRLTPQEIRERVELRAMLEVRAAELASQRMEEAEFAELGRRLAALEEAVAKNAYYEAAQADLQFHRWVWSMSGNQTLRRLLEQLTVPLLAFVSMLRSSGLERLSEVVAAHEPLIAALRSRDPAQIREAFRQGATRSYEEFMDATPAMRRAAAFGMLQGPIRTPALASAPDEG